MEVKYFDIKKLNVTALTLLCVAAIPVQSAYGMKNETDELEPIERNAVSSEKNGIPSNKLSKTIYIHPNSTQTRRSRKVEQLCLEPDIRCQKKFVSEELLKENLLKEKIFLGKDLKERSESEVLLACLQAWERGIYFEKENYVHLIHEFM